MRQPRSGPNARRVKTTPPRELGTRFSLSQLHSRAFATSVLTHFDAEQIDIEHMGVFTRTELVEIARLSALGNADVKLTVSVWQGDYVQFAGTRHPFGTWMLQNLAVEFTAMANDLVRAGKKESFLDGRLRQVRITSQFTKRKRRVVTDVRIRKKGSTTRGVKFVDRAELWANDQDQELFHTTEFKPAGGKGLTEQVAARNERLRVIAAQDDMELTFIEDGKVQTLDVSALVLVTGEAHIYSRNSIQAGRYLKAKFAVDAAGKPYLRLIVPLNSAAVRRVLTKVHADPSWQT